MTGALFGSVMNLLNGIFLEEWNRWRQLLSKVLKYRPIWKNPRWIWLVAQLDDLCYYSFHSVMLRWVWLLTVVVSQNVTGGTLATIMVRVSR